MDKEAYSVMNRLSYDSNGFYLDGQPLQIISGTIHYFRVVPEYWEDRLQKLKECGMNAVETYTCWNLHERKEGVFDFSGGLNLAQYLEIAKKLGLFVILRPGPYICAEWDMGGLPSWLMAIPGMKLRCYHEGFLSKVRNYFKELFHQIRPYLSENGGPVIAVQVENEYGSYGNDHRYMEAVRDIILENDVKSLLFTSDGPCYFMLNGGELKGTLATVNFGSHPTGNFELLKRFRPNQPMMCMEYWNGWFDHWYEEHHTRGSGDTADVMKEMLDLGASVNMYMFHGGTNFGLLNGANYDNGLQPTVTSYDYNCPLSECGDLTEKYYAIREMIQNHTGKVPELTVKNSVKQAYGKVKLTEYACLWDNLKEVSEDVVSTSYPQSFEELGLDFGFVLYVSKLKGPFEVLDLSIDGLCDRALIFLRKEGEELKLLGIKENTGKRDDAVTLGLGFNETAELMILVENMGRVNYGGHILDGKGILRGVRIANQYLFGWEMYPISCEKIDTLKFTSIPEEKQEYPAFFRGTFKAEETNDTFIRLDGFVKGIVYINGFLLGRYWNTAGPQKTLYIPAPLLKKGINEILVFELEAAGEKEITLTDREELG